MTQRRPSSRSTKRVSQMQRRNQRSDFGARILAAIPAAALAVFLIQRGGIIFTIGVIVFGLLCMHELSNLFAELTFIRITGFLAVIALGLAAYYGSQYQLMLVLVCVAPVLFLTTVVNPNAGATSMAITIFGIWWIGLSIAHAILLRELPHGGGIIVAVLVGTFIGDTGAYLGGKTFGQHPLAPKISPNKTAEGLLIGMACAVASVWFTGLYQDWLSGTDALFLGVAVAIAAPIGDLFESFLKRDVDVKDTGKIFGPHGGALDRLDAVFFTLVVGYYVWAALLAS